MFLLQEFSTASPILRFAVNLAAASSVVVALGWFVACLCRRRSGPLQHGVLLSTLLVAACSPLLLLASGALGWGLLSVTAEVSETPRSEVVLGKPPNRVATVPSELADSVPQTPIDVPVPRTSGSLPREKRPPGAATDRGMALQWEALYSAAVWIWGSGIGIGLVAFASGAVSIRRFRRSLLTPAEAEFVAAGRSACGEVGCGRNVAVFVSPLTSAPVSLGLFRPAIVIPEYLAVENSRERLRLVFLHEAAHIARGDHWVALLQRLTAILFWWNPLLHLINRRLGHVRELICDDHAARSLADGRLLAGTLVNAAERTVSLALPGATALVPDEARSLEIRIRRLLERPKDVRTRMNAGGRIVATAIALLLAGLLVASRVRAAATSKPVVRVVKIDRIGRPAANVQVVPAIAGYRRGFLNSRSADSLRTDGAGNLKIPRLRGRAVYVARPESDAPLFFERGEAANPLRVTLPRPPIWPRHVPAKLRSRQLKVVVAPLTGDDRGLLQVQLTNNSGLDLILTKTDLSVFSAGWRVFPPEKQQRRGMIVRGHGGIATLQLDWDRYVRAGLWCRRSSTNEDWPETDNNGKNRTQVRLRVAGVDSAAFTVMRPETVLAQKRSARPADRRKLSGTWRLSLPAGFKHQVSLTPLGRNRFRLAPRRLNMSGIYELRGNELSMVEPNDSRLLGPDPPRTADAVPTRFVWRVGNGKTLRLVEEPPAGTTGARYTGATLTRQTAKSRTVRGDNNR